MAGKQLWLSHSGSWLVLAVLLSVGAATRPACAAGSAEVVLLGGKIITLDPNDRIAEALAIRDGKIVAVGSDEEITKLVGDKTSVIRLGGKTVIPGLIETHCHAIGVARGSLQSSYAELASIGEIQRWIRQRATEVPAGSWIIVPRNEITRLKELRFPTPLELDAACKTHPVAFKAVRNWVFNSLGFQRLGVHDKTKAFPGGELIRDEEGTPRMIIGGDSVIRKFFPTPEFDESDVPSALAKVHAVYNEVGITSINERATDRDGYDMYRQLHREGRLTVRATTTFRRQMYKPEDVVRFVGDLGLKPREGDEWVKAGPLKISLDGGIHWGTTRLREPYGEQRSRFYVKNDPTYQGDLRYTVEQMRDIIATAHRLGWQMSCHVTGDAGVDRLLDALAASDAITPAAKHRFNLIHAYFPTPEAIERGRRLGICVDTQAYVYYKDASFIAKVYGQSWAERLIGIGDWFRGGIPIAINSDHMIGLNPDHAMNSFNPFLQLYVAVTRKDDKGHVYGARQRLSRIDALRTMTSMAAYLSFDEKNRGSLEVGKLADLAVLDRDYLTCSEVEIRDIKVEKTIVGGRTVFERGSLP